MPLDFNEIRQLLVTIAQTDIAEVTLKSSDFELTVRRGVNVSNQVLFSGATGSGLTTTLTAPQVAFTPLAEIATSRVTENAATGVPSSAQNSMLDQRLVEVPSPMVGTFYRAPAPGESSFVEVGDRIKSGQTVCIIEAMKLMNEIEAEISGQVMEILVQNGESVEYGQPLMRINPD
ncbi:acetyl-CoA carboxylase biotin carboxyl carrier protein [Plectonema radiosum NIES-515]|uniref:Biotin carboxyl carrier protein of acetyl-CoA carboxylase n=1 Tax=Plectonema radiosum NIES-515 TaxID=2986073 RepID=A0ABT3AUS0_9CYAN|nr:acetyl-CoA carboxylase biotin carboxyl carrier protein [Plectonema radiosum]MCV3212853.1 acetyl-CoA carboxylase biotin carboxyl carrier protein [Plectonema radiosum NIES-515]